MWLGQLLNSILQLDTPGAEQLMVGQWVLEGSSHPGNEGRLVLASSEVLTLAEVTADGYC